MSTVETIFFRFLSLDLFSLSSSSGASEMGRNTEEKNHRIRETRKRNRKDLLRGSIFVSEKEAEDLRRKCLARVYYSLFQQPASLKFKGV